MLINLDCTAIERDWIRLCPLHLLYTATICTVCSDCLHGDTSHDGDDIDGRKIVQQQVIDSMGMF